MNNFGFHPFFLISSTLQLSENKYNFAGDFCFDHYDQVKKLKKLSMLIKWEISHCFAKIVTAQNSRIR